MLDEQTVKLLVGALLLFIAYNMYSKGAQGPLMYACVILGVLALTGYMPSGVYRDSRCL